MVNRISTIKDAVKDARDKARTVITLRTAATIIAKKLSGDVAAFIKECKGINYTIPKVVKAELDSLNE